MKKLPGIPEAGIFADPPVVSVKERTHCEACGGRVLRNVVHRCGEEPSTAELATARAAAAVPLTGVAPAVVQNTDIIPPAGAIALTDPLSLWLDAITVLADRTEELARHDRRLGPELIGGAKFKALRKVLVDVKKAAEARRALGQQSLGHVEKEAWAYIERNPRSSRRAIAKSIAARVCLTPGRIEKKLLELNLPPRSPPRRPVVSPKRPHRRK